MTGTFPRMRPRLQAVTEAIPVGSRVADIGSDHGHLPRLLIRSGRAVWCIATEYGAGPVRRLRAGVTVCPEADRIEIRQGHGLDPLRPEDRIDVLVLSGMGGPTMLSILDAAWLQTLGVEWLVLQPQSGWAGLRAGLEQRGWIISAERLVRDRGRFYTVMNALPARHVDRELADPAPCDGEVAPGRMTVDTGYNRAVGREGSG